MSFPTKISYCHGTFSPWWGCSHVSPGCLNCFAERMGHRFGVAWGPGKPRRLASESSWKQPLAWNRKAEKAGTRYRILTDMCDVFDSEVPLLWRPQFFRLVVNTPNLDWLILTKRPEQASRWAKMEPLPENVWLGCSICNQAEADEKIPILLSIPATKHWLSVEPMLSGVDISKWIGHYPVHENEHQCGKHSNGCHKIRDAQRRSPGTNLETQKERVGPMEAKGSRPTMQNCSGREENVSGLPTSSSHDGQNTGQRKCPPSCVSDPGGTNTRGNNDQPQERDQVGQPTGESGIGNILREHETRLPDGIDRRTRGTESCGEIERLSSPGHSRGIFKIESDTGESSPEVRSDVSDNIENCKGRSTPKTGRPDSGLHKDETTILETKQHWPILFVVCGGETGPGARPMAPDWVKSLRDQCQSAGVPFWFKSWGSREDYEHGNADYRHSEKAGGNLLAGRKWEEIPKHDHTP